MSGVMHDERGRVYTLSRPDIYRVKDERPIHFIKDPRIKQYYQSKWRWVNLFTRDKTIKRYYLPRAWYSWADAGWDLAIPELNRLKEKLRDYQYESVLAMINTGKTTKGWFVRAWEGTGKTRIMWALTQSLQNLGQVVLVVPTLTIQRWVVKWFKELGFDIYPVSWAKAKIEDDKSYVMHSKTFAMHYDTLNNKNRFLLIDEWHHTPTKMVDSINKRKSGTFGFTASPMRWEFGVEGFKMLYWTMYETDKEALTVKVIWVKRQRNYTIEYAVKASKWLAPDSYEIYRNMLYADKERTNEIVQLALDSYKKTKRVIIFWDRLEFIDELYEKLQEKCQAVYKITWETSKLNIPKQVEKLDSFIIVWSIWSCWEWLDIPSLNTGILTFNTSNYKTIRQAAWRVRRYFWEKEHWYFIDMMDVIQVWEGRKYYWGISARKKIYKDLWFSLQPYQ